MSSGPAAGRARGGGGGAAAAGDAAALSRRPSQAPAVPGGGENPRAPPGSRGRAPAASGEQRRPKLFSAPGLAAAAAFPRATKARTIAAACDGWRLFKAYVVETRVIETGVGVVVGNAFTDTVRSFLNDLLAGPLSLLLGPQIVDKFIVLRAGKNPRRDRRRPYKTLDDAVADGAITVNIGKFVRQLCSFFTMGFAVYYVLRVSKAFFTFRLPEDPEHCECPYCTTRISRRATRCPACCSEVTPVLRESPSEGENLGQEPRRPVAGR